VVGLSEKQRKILIEPDRDKARLGLDEARAGDIVLLAGKGHEDYQFSADQTLLGMIARGGSRIGVTGSFRRSL